MSDWARLPESPFPPDQWGADLSAEWPIEHRTDVPDRVRRPYDDRVHYALSTGWQTLTRCGKRVTWLDVQTPPQYTTDPVDCPECLEGLEEP
jgi:hypothetical protein